MTYTVGAESNMLMLVNVVQDSTQAVTSVVWGTGGPAQTLALVPGSDLTLGSVRSDTYYLAGPHTGPDSVYMTLPGAADVSVGIVTYYNTAPLSPYGAVNQATAAGTNSLTGNLTTQTNGSMVVASYFNDTSLVPTSSPGGAGFANLWDLSVPGLTVYSEGDDQVSPTTVGGPYAFTYNLGANAANLGVVMIEVNPAP